MQVGLAAGADLPLPPPEPFQSRHQEPTQPTAQQHHHQLSQMPPNPASEGDFLQRLPPHEEGALWALPSRLSTGFPTNVPRETSTEIEIPTEVESSPAEGRGPEATPTTTSYAVDDVAEISPAAAGTAAGDDYSRVTDPAQDDHSTAVGTAGDVYHGGEEGRLTTSHLLGRFTVLHRDGRLEEAAATLQQALGLMESKRRKTARRKGSPLRGAVLPAACSIVHEEGKALNSGAKDTMGAQSGGAGDGGNSDNRNISGPSTEPEREVDKDRSSESAAEDSAIAGVMNDLGCTLQQVKEGGDIDRLEQHTATKIALKTAPL